MSLASENLKRIGAANALGRFKEKAFQEWELRCRADLAPAREQSSLALRDELPKFFDQLIGALRTKDSEIKSDLSSMTALEHGKERADFSHYTLDQVIQEYQLLRTVLTEFLEADGYLNSDIRKTLLDFIDQGTRKAAGSFAQVEATRARRQISLPLESESPKEDSAPIPSALWGGEMGAILRSKDWSKTPLGPMEQWPQSLLTTVSLCLASNFPIDIIWGPEHVQIYNDGYRVICGASHPRALGESFPVTWTSAWPVIGEGFAQALQGKTSFLENQNIFIERDGFLEETFFTFSFSPIRDETGEIAGIFHPVLETTTTMLNERRMRVLRDIAATSIKEQTPEEACAMIAETLSKYEADLPFLSSTCWMRKQTERAW